VDRAYIDVTKGILNIKAGQQYMGLGNSIVYDGNNTGIQLTLMTPLAIRYGYSKETEATEYTDVLPSEAAITDNEQYGSEDVDHHFLDLGWKTDTFSTNLFYVMQIDDGPLEDQPWAAGLLGNFNLGPFVINAEIDFFGGDRKTPVGGTVDYKGIQFIGSGEMNISDDLMLGLQLVYSDGTDDANEEKLVRFPGAFFGSTYYSDYGTFQTDLGPLGAGDVFDPYNTGAGAMGAGIYGKWTLMEAWTFYGQLLYLTNDTDVPLGFDSGYVANLSGDWQMLQNTTLSAGVNYSDIDFLDREADAALGAFWRLQIAF
jgi:hypothetical protein